MSRVTTATLKGISATLEQVTIPGGHTFRVNGVLDLAANTGAFQLPTGTTAQRPGSPSTGFFRFNTDTNKIELYRNGAWGSYEETGQATGGGGDDSSLPDERLVYVFDATGDARSPTYKALGNVRVSDNSVTAVAYNDVIANTDWNAVVFTSDQRPYVRWRFDRNASNIDTWLGSLLNNYSNWAANNNSTYSVTPVAGSSGKVGETMNFQHNNGGGESHDIVTLGNNGTVWGSGMYWGNIDSTGNYGGILNKTEPHSGSGGGNTGERLFVYLDNTPLTIQASDYTNYLTPTGPLGDATSFSWANNTSSGQGSSNPRNVADAVDRNTTNSWPTYGIQQQGGTNWISVDLGVGNETSFDYTWVIGYPGDNHWSNRNWVQGSNDNSNWTDVAEWRYHNGTGNNDGYLIYNQGSHVYSNTVNNSDKWHPIVTRGIKYRYWRLYGNNFGASNGYMLVMNWGLMKKN
tara:strand:- start:4530 stop:5912 length:1383 start_codon:yes stop_codon:yes gene_type:complete